ncbi:predicted protein [Arabidopsis lyrata subsp. lyrata]|uniref:Predicted protein n=1 Tax=Arabidopsis lyrata subsp. lyrata TaxID=81972 RepID=D7KUS2_ARALL|nr:predicted protein [Arabidopsis lyrata subsp. lyrata]
MAIFRRLYRASQSLRLNHFVQWRKKPLREADLPFREAYISDPTEDTRGWICTNGKKLRVVGGWSLHGFRWSCL